MRAPEPLGCRSDDRPDKSSATDSLPYRGIPAQLEYLEDLTDFAHQLPGVERFGQERGGRLQIGRWGTRHEQRSGLRTLAAEPPAQFLAVQARQLDVGHEQVDWSGVVRRYFQRLEAIDGLQHAKSARLENPPNGCPHHGLVVGDQNCQAARFAGAMQSTSRTPHTQGHVDSTTGLDEWPRKAARIAPAQGGLTIRLWNAAREDISPGAASLQKRTWLAC